MANLKLPPPPQKLPIMTPHRAQPLLLTWLMSVANECGEPGVDFAVGSGWPGTPQQRAWITAAHIEVIRSHARQFAHDCS